MHKEAVKGQTISYSYFSPKIAFQLDDVKIINKTASRRIMYTIPNKGIKFCYLTVTGYFHFSE